MLPLPSDIFDIMALYIVYSLGGSQLLRSLSNPSRRRAGGEDLNMLSMDEIKVKNKGGLPSHMLFEHMGAPGADRFMSVNAMTFTAGEGKNAPIPGFVILRPLSSLLYSNSLFFVVFASSTGSGGIRCEDLLSEKPSDDAKEALKIKPVKKKMILKSKGDARLDGLINSFETTSAGMAARANVRKANVNPFEGKELGERMPGVTFHRKPVTIGMALG